jgi:hypothetical protein
VLSRSPATVWLASLYLTVVAEPAADGVPLAAGADVVAAGVTTPGSVGGAVPATFAAATPPPVVGAAASASAVVAVSSAGEAVDVSLVAVGDEVAAFEELDFEFPEVELVVEDPVLVLFVVPVFLVDVVFVDCDLVDVFVVDLVLVAGLFVVCVFVDGLLAAEFLVAWLCVVGLVVVGLVLPVLVGAGVAVAWLVAVGVGVGVGVFWSSSHGWYELIRDHSDHLAVLSSFPSPS